MRTDPSVTSATGRRSRMTPGYWPRQAIEGFSCLDGQSSGCGQVGAARLTIGQVALACDSSAQAVFVRHDRIRPAMVGNWS